MTLYRQYRPTHFRELLGQDAVATLLQNALAQSRLAHAYLFSGPRGTGKTTTARLLAKTATCLAPIQSENSAKSTTFEACGKCAACLAFQAGLVQDIIEIDAASNRGIDDIRELREQATYPPLLLRYKVYIIDEVHMLTTEAFNALLKTLEEPSPQTLFILATTELHKVPSTIRSRCQMIRFHSGANTTVRQKLEHICKAEKWHAAPGALTLIAEHAQGGFRDAETLLEQLATQHQPLTELQVMEYLGALPAQAIEQLFTTLLSGNTEAVLAELHTISTLAQVRYEHILLQLLTTARSSIDSRGIKSDLAAYILKQLLEAFILQRSSPIPALPLEIACLSIATAAHTAAKISTPALAQQVHIAPAPDQHTKQPNHTPVAKTSAPLATLSPKPTPVESVPVIELRNNAISDIRLAWKEMVLDVGKDNAPLSQMLRETIFHTVNDDTIVIHVRFKFHVEKLDEKKNKIKVEQILHTLTHKTWYIQYVLGENMPKRTPHKELSSTSSDDAAAVFGIT